MNKEHVQFAGTIPGNYDHYLGPLFFEPYAIELVQRIDTTNVKKVLEIACGTGRVTRHLVQQLPPNTEIIATDLNAGMLAIAKGQLQAPNLRFTEADAQQLPFEEDSFDLVVCQFGFMFVPDKQQAFNETYRVLKTGGELLFATWDSLERNQLTLIIKNVVAKHLDEAAADFYNVPFSFYDQSTITALLNQAGYKDVQTDIVIKEVSYGTAMDAARGLIAGTPAYKVISDKDPNAPERLIEIAGREVSALCGDGIITTQLSALICKASKGK